MKKILLLITSLLFLQQGLTKEQTSDLSYLSEKGEFKVYCYQEGFCTLRINGLDITTQFPFMGQNEDFISPYSYNEKGLYLLKVYHGDGCPSMYRVLHLLKENKHHISEAFGNCNELTDFTSSRVKHQATIQFPAFKQASRQAISYTYSFSHHELKQKDNCD